MQCIKSVTLLKCLFQVKFSGKMILTTLCLFTPSRVLLDVVNVYADEFSRLRILLIWDVEESMVFIFFELKTKLLCFYQSIILSITLLTRSMQNCKSFNWYHSKCWCHQYIANCFHECWSSCLLHRCWIDRY